MYETDIFQGFLSHEISHTKTFSIMALEIFLNAMRLFQFSKGQKKCISIPVWAQKRELLMGEVFIHFVLTPLHLSLVIIGQRHL